MERVGVVAGRAAAVGRGQVTDPRDFCCARCGLIFETMLFGADYYRRREDVVSEFKIGDRVGAKPEMVKRMLASEAAKLIGYWPTYGHVVNIGAQSVVWVRDHLGGEWGLPEHELEHID